MVAHIRAMAVQRKQWMRDGTFKTGVALCQVVPGATAMQTAAYVGYRTRGLRGGVAAFVGFGLPAFLLMAALSVAYEQAHQLPRVVSLFQGLRFVVLVLVAHAAWGFGRSSVRGWREAVVAALAIAVFVAARSPVLGIFLSCLVGAVLLHGQQVRGEPSRVPIGRGVWQPAALVLAFGLVLLGCLFVVDPRLATLGLLAMKVDALAFGGGFSSIPLINHEVVDVRGWMSSETFMDGIALGQVTPGPIVITATFVGYHVAGWLGASAATVCIFLPSFLMVVLVAPWFERLQCSRVFRAIAQGAALSFVGLLVAITVQFTRAMHWTAPGAALSAGALAALLLKVDVVWVVLGGAAISMLLL
jgi:chromate transporter